MSKLAFVNICTKVYMEQAMYLFGALRNVGKWQGDLVLLANGGYGEFSSKDVWDFTSRGVIVERIPTTSPLMAGKYAFATYLKRWDKICAINQDYIVYKDVSPLFEQPELLLAEQHAFGFDACFRDDFKVINLQEKMFVPDCMIIDTKLIEDNDETIKRLDTLNKSVRPFLKERKVDDSSTDCLRNVEGDIEPLLNVFFHGQFQVLNYVNYIQFNDKAGLILQREDGEIMAHTTHWHAPWNTEFPDGRIKYYYDNLAFFLENKRAA
jgi:hypothetical protein